MGRKKQNFKINIPTKWEEITLNKFIQLQSLYKDDYKPSFIEIISVLSNVDEKELKEAPALIIEKITDKLEYLSQPISNELNNKIIIDNETYQINYMEELKFGEYVDVNTVLDADRSNFPAILGIICRKEGETYNDDFIAKILPKRIEMFGNQPITNVYPLINFFLTLSQVSESNIQQFSEKLKDHTNRTLTHYINSLENGTGKKHFLNSPMRKLKRLQKSLKSI